MVDAPRPVQEVTDCADPWYHWFLAKGTGTENRVRVLVPVPTVIWLSVRVAILLVVITDFGRSNKSRIYDSSGF